MRKLVLLCSLSLFVGCATTKTGLAPENGSAASAKGDDVIWTDAASVEAQCNAALEAGRAVRDTIVREGASDQEVIRGFDNLSLAIDETYGWTQLMFSVHPDKVIREAAQGCEKSLSKFLNDVSLDRALYEAAGRVDGERLEGLAKRVHAHQMRDFRRSGVSKSEETRARLAKLHEEMVELGQTFQKNVLADVRGDAGIRLLYVTPERLSCGGALTSTLNNLHRHGLLKRFVIDECHCVSQWGHDFRADYVKLGALKRMFPAVPTLAEPYRVTRFELDGLDDLPDGLGHGGDELVVDAGFYHLVQDRFGDALYACRKHVSIVVLRLCVVVGGA